MRHAYAVRCLGWLFLAAGLTESAGADGPAVRVTRVDGGQESGRLVLDAGVLRFEPEGDGPPIAWSGLSLIEPAAEPGAAKFPIAEGPFRLILGRGLALSGRLESIDGSTVRLVPTGLGPAPPASSIARHGAVALRQRLGRAQVLSDPFDAIDPARWRVEGVVELVEVADRPGKVARLEAGGAALVHRLESPMDAGRIDLEYRFDPLEATGHSALVEFGFEGPEGPESLRAILGWGNEYPGAVSRGGSGLVVQPLVVRPGWHRLSLRFGPDRTLLAIDGDLLATGSGPGGPLTELRVRTEAGGRPTGPDDLAFHVDNLEIVRLFEPSASVEVDPTQDELRLVGGDQIWGRLDEGDAEGVRMAFGGRVVPFPWSEVTGIYFRRQARPSEPIEGPLARIEWIGDGGPEEADRLEGAVVELNAEQIVLDVPYVGRLSIPLDRLARLIPLGAGRQVVLDPTAHHLGDQPIPELDPVLPESDRLDLEFRLETVPTGPAQLRLDAVDVEGDVEGARFAEAIGRGELVTEVTLNGKSIGTLNERVRTSNKVPERITIELPEGVLVAGSNRLSLVQKGRADEPTYRDDLGILAIAIEWPTP